MRHVFRSGWELGHGAGHEVGWELGHGAGHEVRDHLRTHDVDIDRLTVLKIRGLADVGKVHLERGFPGFFADTNSIWVRVGLRKVVFGIRLNKRAVDADGHGTFFSVRSRIGNVVEATQNRCAGQRQRQERREQGPHRRQRIRRGLGDLAQRRHLRLI